MTYANLELLGSNYEEQKGYLRNNPIYNNLCKMGVYHKTKDVKNLTSNINCWEDMLSLPSLQVTDNSKELLNCLYEMNILSSNEIFSKFSIILQEFISQKIENSFTLIDEEAIKGFLVRNSHLVGMLINASIVIKRVFQNKAILSLQLKEDPDIENYLVCEINSEFDISESLHLLDIFDEVWLIRNTNLLGTSVVFQVK